jgi:hypothetical protein
LRRLLLFVLLYSSAALAQGGPPLLTDDPGTPGRNNWEVNIGWTIDHRNSGTAYDAPVIDVNYGWGNRIQINYQVPYIVENEAGQPYRSGLGNSEFAVKWRFFENERTGWALSSYPRLNFNNPTNSVRRGLENDGTSFLLPFEVTKKLGPIDLNAEVGHWFSTNSPGWITGLAIGHQATKRLEVLGEVYHATARAADDRLTTFDFGGRYRLHKPIMAIFMAGRSFESGSTGQPTFIGYFGVQVLFGDNWNPEDVPKKTKRP